MTNEEYLKMINELLMKDDIKIEPLMISDIPSEFEKINNIQRQNVLFDSFLNIMPKLFEGVPSNAYYVKFPKGAPHNLMPLKQGGFSTAILNEGRIAGTASLYPAADMAMALERFAMMEALSVRYILNELFSRLDIINNKLDKLIQLFYGDKKAELISEINYVKYVYGNYTSIVSNDYLRPAAVIGLEQAKIIAMKDIEFYFFDIDNITKNKLKDLESAENALRIMENIKLSEQLFVMSSLLEIYMSGNYDSDYLASIKNEVDIYINRCQGTILAKADKLKDAISAFNIVPPNKSKENLKKELFAKAEEIYNSYNAGHKSRIKKISDETFVNLNNSTEYYIDNKQNLYVRKKA